ncbi:MAG: hypothetical protein ACYTGL_17560 [Planctomycetota bacterium]
MRTATTLSMIAAAVILAAGCIISDELTTITLHADGSADLIKFRSNIRSTEQGAKGEQEVQKYIADFDARKDAGMVRVLGSGGEVNEARWIQSREPCSNVVVSRLPTALVVQKFFTITNNQGETLAKPKFTQDGSRRRLSISIPVPDDIAAKSSEPVTREQQRQHQADGISETRFAVAEGRIVASRGVVVSRDRRSCVVDSSTIEQLIREQPDHIELFLEWDLNAE